MFSCLFPGDSKLVNSPAPRLWHYPIWRCKQIAVQKRQAVLLQATTRLGMRCCHSLRTYSIQ